LPGWIGLPILSRSARDETEARHLTLIVAIDGPAGSGKSTTARLVAQRLGYLYIDTGAMYRAVALAFLRSGLTVTSEAASQVLPTVNVHMAGGGAETSVLLNGEDVSAEIRRPDLAALASKVSALPEVRDKLVAEQRRLAGEQSRDGGGVVLEGRDIGTVVFPDATVKVFMVADESVRAARRHDELAASGTAPDPDEVLDEIRRRDRRDRERQVAPLLQADDAVLVDTTEYSIEEQVEFVVDLVRERLYLSSV
jgi:CMP/dCMP kinase